jgi:hypothetical protein
VAIDCRSTGLPSYENPYAMDFQVHSSTVYLYYSTEISHHRVPQSAPAAACFDLFSSGDPIVGGQEYTVAVKKAEFREIVLNFLP